MANEQFAGMKDADLVLMKHEVLTKTPNEDKEFIKAIDEELSRRHNPTPTKQGLMEVLEIHICKSCSYKGGKLCPPPRERQTSCGKLSMCCAEIMAMLPVFKMCNDCIGLPMLCLKCEGIKETIDLIKQRLEGKEGG